MVSILVQDIGENFKFSTAFLQHLKILNSQLKLFALFFIICYIFSMDLTSAVRTCDSQIDKYQFNRPSHQVWRKTLSLNVLCADLYI